jgi:hypothetical protein
MYLVKPLLTNRATTAWPWRPMYGRCTIRSYLREGARLAVINVDVEAENKRTLMKARYDAREEWPAAWLQHVANVQGREAI